MDIGFRVRGCKDRMLGCLTMVPEVEDDIFPRLDRVCFPTSRALQSMRFRCFVNSGLYINWGVDLLEEHSLLHVPLPPITPQMPHESFQIYSG